VDWSHLAQFFAAVLVILMMPGPVMVIIAHNTLRHGAMAGLSTAVGVELGESCLLGAVSAGLSLSGELLPSLFRWLSLAGALYLLWLAVSALRYRNRTSRHSKLSRGSVPVVDGLTIAFANPAGLLFYAAFFPQFVDPDYSILKQMLLLGATYICTALAFDSACILAVTRLRLPIDRARIGRIANLGSAAVYASIACIIILRLTEAPG
jgi:threonine/homoserine/homoserine lactone efflux protein